MPTYYFIRLGVKAQRDSTQLDGHCLRTMYSAQIKTFSPGRRQGSINIIPTLKEQLDSQLMILHQNEFPKYALDYTLSKEREEFTSGWKNQKRLHIGGDKEWASYSVMNN